MIALNDSPSRPDWDHGSAQLFAGGGAGETSSIGGVFNSSIDSLSERTAWSIGSARCWWKCL